MYAYLVRVGILVLFLTVIKLVRIVDYSFFAHIPKRKEILVRDSETARAAEILLITNRP